MLRSIQGAGRGEGHASLRVARKQCHLTSGWAYHQLSIVRPKILIFLPANIGDTVVALPLLHLIARRFPESECRILSRRGRSAAAGSCVALLEGAGLAHGWLEADYAQVMASWRERLALAAQIRRWHPDTLIYLGYVKSLKRLLVEALFFRLCGARRLVGIPWARALREHRWRPERGRWEYESERLARCLHELGDARLSDRASWDLRLTAEEHSRGLCALAPARTPAGVIVASVGATADVKDWGADNWRTLLGALNRSANGYGLAFVGAAAVFERSEVIRQAWRGPSVNLCGRLSVRESAAIMSHGTVFVGHDDGPMHLAAAAGLPCVALFSGRARPGVWFPFGEHHKVIYHSVPCQGCGLEACLRYAKRCIASITVDEVVAAVHDALGHAQSRHPGGLGTGARGGAGR